MAKRIGIISDTHGLLRPEVISILKHVTAFYMQEMLTGRKSLTSSGILAVFMSCVEIMTVTGPKSFQLHCDLK